MNSHTTAHVSFLYWSNIKIQRKVNSSMISRNISCIKAMSTKIAFARKLTFTYSTGSGSPYGLFSICKLVVPSFQVFVARSIRRLAIPGYIPGILGRVNVVGSHPQTNKDALEIKIYKMCSHVDTSEIGCIECIHLCCKSPSVLFLSVFFRLDPSDRFTSLRHQGRTEDHLLAGKSADQMSFRSLLLGEQHCLSCAVRLFAELYYQSRKI